MNIPEVTFKTRIGDDQNLGGGCSIGGKWKDISTKELFDNKKIVLFSLPGAYTPTCSSQQLPGYEEKYEDLKKFVDEVYCLSVNDAFVMNAWFRDQNIKKVKPIGDGEGKFTKGMGMLVDKPKQGFGSDGGGGPKPAVDEFVKSHNFEIEIAGGQFAIFV